MSDKSMIYNFVCYWR